MHTCKHCQNISTHTHAHAQVFFIYVVGRTRMHPGWWWVEKENEQELPGIKQLPPDPWASTCHPDQHQQVNSQVFEFLYSPWSTTTLLSHEASSRGDWGHLCLKGCYRCAKVRYTRGKLVTVTLNISRDLSNATFGKNPLRTSKGRMEQQQKESPPWILTSG